MEREKSSINSFLVRSMSIKSFKVWPDSHLWQKSESFMLTVNDQINGLNAMNYPKHLQAKFASPKYYGNCLVACIRFYPLQCFEKQSEHYWGDLLKPNLRYAYWIALVNLQGPNSVSQQCTARMVLQKLADLSLLLYINNSTRNICAQKFQ